MQKAKVDTIDLGQEPKKRSYIAGAQVFATTGKANSSVIFPLYVVYAGIGNPIHMLVSSGPL